MKLPTVLVLGLPLLGCAWDSRLGMHVNAIHDGADAALILKVVDSDGQPVSHADVLAGFVCNAKGKSSSQATNTDDNGLAGLDGLTSGQINYRVTKDGYYWTEGRVDFGAASPPIANGKWLPWNATNAVVLKEIRNPAPMFVMRGEYAFPTNTLSAEFDLFISDWVRPYGKGERGDISAHLEEEVTDKYTWRKRLTLTFGSGEFDGVLAQSKDLFSALRSSYQAPTSGYSRSLTWEYSRTEDGTMSEAGPAVNDCLIFRVRSNTNEHGEIVGAYYGKIYAPIEYGRIGGGKTWFKILYYLNPVAGDRNLEFDPAKNLFPRLGNGRKYWP